MSNESKGRQEETLASGGGGRVKVRDEGVVRRVASNTLRSRVFQVMK